MAHTNSDLYFRNNKINKYVGGKLEQKSRTDDKYIKEQLSILNDQNHLLYPPLRYGQPSPKTNPLDTFYKQTNDNGTNLNLLGAQSSGCCTKGSNTDMLNKTNGQRTYTNPNEPLNDTYLLGEKNQYDPYLGYEYDHGLYIDNTQRRRYIYNYIDINSVYRQQQSIIDVNNEYQLTSNPLTFTTGSNIMHITTNPLLFNVNDPITLTNVTSKYVVLRTIRGTINNMQLPTFEILPGYNFMKIWYDHHVPLTYPSTVRTTIQLVINGIVGDSPPVNGISTFLGNIPVSTLNTTQIFYLTLTQDNLNPIPPITDILAIDPHYFDPSSDYFFVVIPIALQALCSLLDALNGDNTCYTLANYNFNMLFTSLEAIPLNTINTSSQINPNQLTSFHIISSIDSTGISIMLPFTAFTDTDSANNDTVTINSGGNFILLGHISQITTGYPNPNSYTIGLPAIYHNVISIKLASTEIPNANKTIRDYPSASVNNKLYWNDIDDGDYLYQISVPAGNYTPDDLITALSAAFAATPRINSSSTYDKLTYTATHFIETTINLNTNVVTFTPYKEFLLQNPIIDVYPTISVNPNIGVEGGVTYQLTINQTNHGITAIGTVILIQNATDDFGIPAATINGTHPVTKIISLNQYMISLPYFTLNSTRTNTGGGVNVFIYVPDTVRFRFDQPDTLGTVLGFRNPGDPLSITPYSSLISNAAPYAQELTTNILGQPVNITNNSLQMAGDNYILMTADPVQVYQSISVIPNAFAKIILCDSPGKILYNSFVNMTQLYENPISTLSELSIAFYTPNGALVDFDGLEHSFTLEIVTVADIPKDTRINANTGKNYNQTI